MQFIHNDLGQRKGGESLEITLSGVANVRLMDDYSFFNYKSGKKFTFTGGLAKVSPVRLNIPGKGHWHLVIDMEGLRGSVTSKVKIIS